jgi:allantoicase
LLNSLSAGLKGPFNNKWMNSWEKRKKRGKLVDRIVVNETPKCAAAPEWKKRMKIC